MNRFEFSLGVRGNQGIDLCIHFWIEGFFFFIVVNVSTLESSLNPTDNGSHALQVQRQVVEEMFSSLCLLRTKKPQWDQDVAKAGALHKLQLYRPHQAKQCDHNKHNCCQLHDWLWYVDIHFTWEQ